MRSTKLFFNSTLFSKTIRRFWPFWVLCLFVWVLIIPVLFGNELAWNAMRGHAADITTLFEINIYFGIVFAAIACCLSAMLVYSWMYNSRSVGAYFAFPVRREGLFLSTGLAGLAPLLATHLLSAVITWIVGLCYGFNLLLPLLQCVAVNWLFTLFFFGLATLCAVLTGHVFVLPAVYTIFNFVAVVVEVLFYELFSGFVYGIGNVKSTLTFLSPAIQLFEEMDTAFLDNIGNTATGITGWGWALAYAVVGLLFMLGALLIFRRRKAESASEVVAVRALKPVFKYCLCFGCALTLGMLLFYLFFDGTIRDDNRTAKLILLTVSMLISALIGYYAAEMLIRKSFRVFSHSWKGVLISAAAIILFVIAMDNDVLGYERYVPEVHRIEQVRVFVGGDDTVFTEPSDIAEVVRIHQSIVKNKNYNRKREYNYRNAWIDGGFEDEASMYYPTITYELNNGRSVTRRYCLVHESTEATSLALFKLVNTPSAILSRIGQVDVDSIYNCEVSWSYHLNDRYYDDYKQFTAAEAQDLFRNGILADARQGNIATLGPNGSHYYKTYSFFGTESAMAVPMPQDLYFHISMESRVYQEEGDYYSYDYHSFTVTPEASNTLYWLQTHGVDIFSIFLQDKDAA